MIVIVVSLVTEKLRKQTVLSVLDLQNMAMSWRQDVQYQRKPRINQPCNENQCSFLSSSNLGFCF